MDQHSALAEQQRQEILRHYEILDTPPEASFDRIVAIAAAVFGTTMGVITLVDRERSWYKSELGFGVSELPRVDNMCDAAIRYNDVLVINDSHEEPAELVAPMIKAGLRFYAGAPLRTSEGIIFGTLCAVDPLPHQVTETQRRILADLAETVVEQLELRLTAKKMAEAEVELRRLNKDLESASRNKSEFLASMSHELRTPLNGILGASELLDQGLFGALNPKQQEYVQDIHQSGNHLLRLIDDVLDLSRIEAGQILLETEPLDVTHFIDSCASLVRGLTSARSIELVLLPPDEPLTVEADERRLIQVGCNLLSNALKYTPEGGRVMFKASRSEDEAVFVVDDRGPGIAPEFQDRIFEQFYRVSTDREGTGLGLPLARRLIELQGGRIWVESRPGEGSRFYFSVPLSSSD
jgi:signal transduction histidine kinase